MPDAIREGRLIRSLPLSCGRKWSAPCGAGEDGWWQSVRLSSGRSWCLRDGLKVPEIDFGADCGELITADQAQVCGKW